MASEYRKQKKLAKSELEAYGFRRNFAVRSGPWVFVTIVSVLALFLALLSHAVPWGLNPPQVGTLVIAMGAFLLGYHQWREARNETSMDRFYDRLELADRRLDSWPPARELVKQFWPTVTDEESYQRSMYAYVELDNFEYVIEKYKLGYMNELQALRGLKTFKSRCTSQEFRKLALQLVQCAGYNRTTIEAVKVICKELQPPRRPDPETGHSAITGEAPVIFPREPGTGLQKERAD